MIKKRNIRQAFQWIRQFWGWLRRLCIWMLRAWPLIIISGIALIHYLVLFSLGKYGLTTAIGYVNSVISFTAQIIGLSLILLSIDSNLRLFEKEGVDKKIKKWWKARPKFKTNTILLPLHPVGISTSFLSAEIKSIPNYQEMNVEEKLEYLKQEMEDIKERSKKEDEEIRRHFDAKTENMNKRIGSLGTEVRDIGSKMTEMSVGGLDLQLFGVFVAAYGLFVDSFLQ